MSDKKPATHHFLLITSIFARLAKNPPPGMLKWQSDDPNMVEPSVPVLSDIPRQNLSEIPKIRKMTQEIGWTLPLCQTTEAIGKVLRGLKICKGRDLRHGQSVFANLPHSLVNGCRE
jgi:hypothetical protein